MKHIPLLLVIGFALSLYNLSNRFKSGKSKAPGSGTTASAEGGGTEAVPAEPTAAQTAALAGGQEEKWDQQGMAFTLPPKGAESSDESKEIVWACPGGSNGASLIVSIVA